MTGVSLPGLDLVALQRFIHPGVVPGVGELRAEFLHGGRSNLTYLITDGPSTWVLRRPPMGVLAPSAHDVEREYRVVDALYQRSFPVPRPVVMERSGEVLGVPFCVVDYVEGMTYRRQEHLDLLSDAEVAQKAFALVDVLADLHELDPRTRDWPRSDAPRVT